MNRQTTEAASTMETCERVDELMQVTMCKNLFLCNRSKQTFTCF